MGPPSGSPLGPKFDAKIVILGSGGVGKTSLIQRYIHNEFSDTISTLGTAVTYKKWHQHTFGIFDTAGQDKFQKVSAFYCKGADAAIIAYDITDRNSFLSLADYVQMVRSGNKASLLVFSGTKLDIVLDNPEMRQVTESEGRSFANSHSGSFFETSAKTNSNVSVLFDTVGNLLLPKDSPRLADNSPVISPFEAGDGPPDGLRCDSNFACCRTQ